MRVNQSGRNAVKNDKLNLSAVETGLDMSQRTVPRGNAQQQNKSVLGETHKRPKSATKPRVRNEQAEEEEA